MKYGTQVVSLGVIIAIIINYYRGKKMSLISTKVFSAFLWVSFLNIVLEFCTLYTIVRIDESPMLNRLAHQAFIGSMDLAIFLLFLYVDLKSRTQKRYSSPQLILRVLPLFLSLVFVVFSPLYYYEHNGVCYSYGPMATTVYISVAIYVVAIGVLLLRKTQGFTSSAKITISIGIALWAALAVLQYLNPEILLSSMGISIMVLFLYISFEHPMEYADHELRHCLNSFALKLMLNESFARKKPFYTVSLHILNGQLITGSFGREAATQLLGRMASALFGGLDCYHSQNGVLSLVLNGKEYDSLSACWPEKLSYHDKELNISPEYFISIIPCPDYASDSETALALISFMSEVSETEGFWGCVTVDEEIIGKMQYVAGVERLLQSAVSNDGFDVFYQPIYSTEKRGFVSCEALIRLRDTETLGYISPEIFIPLAEQKGLIKEIGCIVLDKVCSFANENRLFENGLEFIEINVSGLQGVDSSFVEYLSAVLNKYGIDPRCINLEITETAAIENGKLLLNNMENLHGLGCQFSMDDFGTGYSNLAQLADTKYDLIKLDKSLLWSYYYDRNDKALGILSGCIDLIQRLGIRTVQEGVETREQADYLESRNINYLQGYYFSRPISESDFLAFLGRGRLQAQQP